MPINSNEIRVLMPGKNRDVKQKEKEERIVWWWCPWCGLVGV